MLKGPMVDDIIIVHIGGRQSGLAIIIVRVRVATGPVDASLHHFTLAIRVSIVQQHLIAPLANQHVQLWHNYRISSPIQVGLQGR